MSNYLSHIYSLGQLLTHHQIEWAVASPGSRSAPLLMALVRESNIQILMIRDERSAGFIAMGIAQQTQKATVLICTSGSAALNLAPAVCEAHYQNIPLLVLTADRPPEWIDQEDGQTIVQRNIYQNFCKSSFQLLPDYENPESFWYFQRTVNEAIITSAEIPKGPVHINFPLREPLYPKTKFNAQPVKTKIQIVKQSRSQPPKEILSLLQSEKKILLVAGQGNYSAQMQNQLNAVKVPIVADCTANLFKLQNTILLHDLFLSNLSDKTSKKYQPDIVLSFGNSVLSKSLKQFLRNYPPKKHLKIGKQKNISDTFQCLTHVLTTTAEDFFTQQITECLKTSCVPNYFQLWQSIEKGALEKQNNQMKQLRFSELHAVQTVLNHFPKSKQLCLHLGNSMPVRYVNRLQSELRNLNCEVFANRGVSGIDGTMSTAVGSALAKPKVLHVLILGDLSFFYDINALWNDRLPDNLRIVVLNNKGGIIFRYLPKTAALPELENYFETRHSFELQYMAKTFGIEHTSTHTATELKSCLHFFFEGSGTKLLEIHLDPLESQKVWQHMNSTR